MGRDCIFDPTFVLPSSAESSSPSSPASGIRARLRPKRRATAPVSPINEGPILAEGARDRLASHSKFHGKLPSALIKRSPSLPLAEAEAGEVEVEVEGDSGSHLTQSIEPSDRVIPSTDFQSGSHIPRPRIPPPHILPPRLFADTEDDAQAEMSTARWTYRRSDLAARVPPDVPLLPLDQILTITHPISQHSAEERDEEPDPSINPLASSAARWQAEHILPPNQGSDTGP